MDKKSICKYAGKCNGCQLLNMEYEKQLSYKQQKVIKLLGRFCHVDEIIGADDAFNYRNKATFAFCPTYKGETICGIYNSTTKNVVSVKRCRIDNPKADRIVNSIYMLMRSFKIQPFDERTGRGTVRYVTVRTADKTGEILVLIVTAKNELPKKQAFIKRLLSDNPEIKTVVHGINQNEKAIFLDKIQEVLYGKGYIEDELCGKRFIITADSFYQINHNQTEKLYSKAIEFANLQKNERILDAYCGVGTITILASDFVKESIGFEINKTAVKNAQDNIKLNNCENVKIFNCDASNFEADKGFDTVFLDPPRAGCSYSFLRKLIKMKSKKIVYVSCNPETQARDLNTLTKTGYKVQKIQPVDMFPNTKHIETVVLLTKM